MAVVSSSYRAVIITGYEHDWGCRIFQPKTEPSVSFQCEADGKKMQEVRYRYHGVYMYWLMRGAYIHFLVVMVTVFAFNRMISGYWQTVCSTVINEFSIAWRFSDDWLACSPHFPPPRPSLPFVYSPELDEIIGLSRYIEAFCMSNISPLANASSSSISTNSLVILYKKNNMGYKRQMEDVQGHVVKHSEETSAIF